MNENEVIEVLKEVVDPEIGVNVVDLGLIYGVKVSDGKVKVKMTLTSPMCPLSSIIVKEVERKIKERLNPEEVDVELTFDPPWSPEMMSEEAKRKLGIPR
ncbi:aromatic ring hydroxylase [Thermococci archaeon]|nr:MAG: aromatic ring hydroxylase [Thermococci archaeon]RLF96635.1 MAG: aromatic ring hydroxylase [Thermococci archaeon]